MPPPRRRLEVPRVLWVEGKDDSAVVQGLCKKATVPYVFDVEEKGGIERLLAGIGVEVRERRLERFGVVVDADTDAAKRWSVVRRIFSGEGYADLPDNLPDGGIIVPETSRLPRVGVWIMPDNRSPGAIEEFATLLVAPGDVLFGLATQAVDGIPQEHRRFMDTQRGKAYIHTWLAWQTDPGAPMGQAIANNDLDANAPAAHGFIAWLRRLMVDE
jgi:hypothetical protein